MPGNPRFDIMLASVQKDGILEPLTINLDWLVLDGNHRLSAAKLLGMDTVEVKIWTGTEFIM
jgi:ParB-like chromosome segregation protein Spo0J